MDIKVKLGIALVVAFFAGAIVIAEVPSVSSLVVIAEIAIGWILGMNYQKNK